MPTNYIKSLSKKHKISEKKLEEIWERAKQASSNKNNYGIITTIFKSMINKEFELNENRKDVNLFIANKTMYLEETEKIKSELNENFYKWFKGSKIVDSKGNPLICYHGSKSEFDKFDDSFVKRGWLGNGFYFTDDKKTAKSFGKKIITAYISLKKPYNAESNDPNSLITELRDKYNLSSEQENDISIVLKKKGFDGLVYKHWDSTGTFYSVFNPTKIKSIYNDGSFDNNDKNIYS